MDTLTRERPATRVRRELLAARAHTDQLFALVADGTLYQRPVADRHRLIFYVGHLDAFDWNQLGRGVLDLPSFQPSFDRLFEAGIDPAPGEAPVDRSTDWPTLDEVRAYVARTRRQVDELWEELPAERVLTVLEHRWMHAETLCYLLHQLAPSTKRAPVAHVASRADRIEHATARAHWLEIAGGRDDARSGGQRVRLGQ